MTAPVVTGNLSRDGRTVLVRCPYCAAEHTHGAAGIVGSNGDHRFSHCLKPTLSAAAGYIVRLPEVIT